MRISENALKVLKKRYFAQGENWEGLCRRVAATVAGDEAPGHARRQWEATYQQMMENLDFLPNSPTLRNFGRNRGSGSACFVLPIEDSRRSIFKTLSDAVDVQAYGGGTGMDFSPIRPAGDPVRSTEGKATGPVSIMGIFDYAIGDIIQQGGTRLGANMGILRVDHPDIETFIRCKTDEENLNNFNISVAVPDDFMRAVEADADLDLVFGGKTYQTTKARRIWERIVDGAWRNGEPGIVFIDTINRANPLSALGRITATNPCGEQPLLPFSSCNLGSINLSRMVSGNWMKERARLDEEKLKQTVAVAVRFLDSVISVNHYPLEKIKEMTLNTRQIGLGIMGFADLCIQMHVRYGSGESLDLATAVMELIHQTAHDTSVSLAREKGAAPAFNVMAAVPRRNGALTSIAPTGTLSVIADSSSGCEPHFAFDYTKACLDGDELKMTPRLVREWIRVNREEPLPDFFVTAADVPVMEHIQVQAAFQVSGVDAGVSKTINAPFDTGIEAVSDAFVAAWKQGCKGITFYRDGSRDTQALYTGADRQKGTATGGLRRGELKERPRATTGPSLKMKTACGKLYVDPHFDADGVMEVFIRTVGGGCAANTKALGVLLSYCLRAGVAPETIIRSMKAIHCPACTKAISAGKDVEVNSCAAGMGKGLEVAIENVDLYRKLASQIQDADKHFNGKPRTANKRRCPDCGSELNRAGGCVICANPECGWSRC
jgi:ribonucleoside-diphosphate reductase alpha chain